jgi:hypothetical protein
MADPSPLGSHQVRSLSSEKGSSQWTVSPQSLQPGIALIQVEDNLDRFRKVSVELIDGESSIGAAPKTAQEHLALARTKSVEALGQEARRDKFAQWVKDVEREY